MDKQKIKVIFEVDAVLETKRDTISLIIPDFLNGKAIFSVSAS